jgi:hypothetical protein
MESTQSFDISLFENFSPEVLSHGLESEKISENIEMTEQEIESIKQILNEKEISIIQNHNLQGIPFLVKLSVVPKFSTSDLSIKFNDKVMKSMVAIRALPAVEVLIALPESYPSH